MSLLNQVFQGNPNALGAVAAGGTPVAPNLAVDTVNAGLFLSAGNGWQPLANVIAKSVISAQTAATQSNLLTFKPSFTGLYRITAYTVQATSTNGTLPEVDVAYTEGDTSTAETGEVVLASGATTGIGQHKSGSIVINALKGVNIVLSSQSAATLTYDIKTRIEFLG